MNTVEMLGRMMPNKAEAATADAVKNYTGGLYIGTGGTISVEHTGDAAGSAVDVVVPDNFFYKRPVRKIISADTTASGIIGYYSVNE